MSNSRLNIKPIAAAVAGIFLSSQAHSALMVSSTIDFNDLIAGETSYLYDAEKDGIADVIFSTTDDEGFSTAGPGPDQLFISEPGLEGGTGLTPDLRIDLLRGGADLISFGFATTDVFPGVVQVFDAQNNQIGSQVFVGEFFEIDDGGYGGGEDEYGGSTFSGFPENFVEVDFDGTAAYVTLDFDSDSDGYGGGGRYIIDDFTFTQAQEDILDLFEGGDPMFPVLPDPFDPENPEFRFELEIIEDGLGTRFPIFIDPIIAVGYEYEISSGQLVETVLIPATLPNGDSEFKIVINGVEYDLFAGITFDIFAQTGIVGVSSFEILGISTAEALNPADSMAFNTGLTFSSGGTLNITQTPIVFNTDPNNPNPIPEPGTLAALLAGLVGLAYTRRRRYS